MIAASNEQVARALGGIVTGGQILAPGPDHSPKDRSLRVKLDPDAPDGFVVTSFSNDDPLACRDHVRHRLKLPRWSPSSEAATDYVYRDAAGAPLLRVSRYVPKAFSQSRWDGQRWVSGGIEKAARTPYRLPEIIEAIGLGATVYIVEGEKAADTLAGKGLAATCSPGGAGKWPDHFSRWFAGAEVIVLPDNDDPGRSHAAAVVNNLKDVVRSVRCIALPGLRAKGDPHDYIQAGGDPDAIADLPEVGASTPGNADPAPPSGLPLLDPAAWEGLRPPIREWEVKDWVPARQATYLTGAGSTGNSLAGQQAATCVALGRRFLGVETRRGPALYLSCEDDAEELHRRQDAICDALDVRLADLSGHLHLVSLAGAQGNELATFDALNRMETTPAWDRLRKTALALSCRFIVLDNVAHLFAGNENIRNHVAAFCGLLNRLAADAGAAVLFIGHPNKAGADFSGSTAWENQVRSRLYLKTPVGEGGEFVDPDLRVLSREKSNYARRGEAITFRWHRWAFVRDQDLGREQADSLTTHLLAKTQDERFLACLEKVTAEKRTTSPNTSAPNYAPRVFAKMPSGAGIGVPGFEAALHRLLDQAVIVNDQPIYRRPNRTWATGLGAAQSRAQNPAQSDAQECTKPELNH